SYLDEGDDKVIKRYGNQIVSLEVRELEWSERRSRILTLPDVAPLCPNISELIVDICHFRLYGAGIGGFETISFPLVKRVGLRAVGHFGGEIGKAWINRSPDALCDVQLFPVLELVRIVDRD